MEECKEEIQDGVDELINDTVKIVVPLVEIVAHKIIGKFNLFLDGKYQGLFSSIDRAKSFVERMEG